MTIDPAVRFLQIFFVSLMICGCASYQTFSNVRPEELNSSTLWPGLELQLVYDDGSFAKFTVHASTEDMVISTSGKQWPKEGIKKLTIKDPASSLSCRFTYWRHRVPCQGKEEVNRKGGGFK
jgi:hypothetical protein